MFLSCMKENFMPPKTITIFYSWQSDLPRKVNKNLILNALQQAKDELEEEFPDIHIIIDEATRNRTGSPNIVESILNKIENCDFYIADISIINNQETATKKMPNPNVLFECGYALNVLGTERITLLFNEHFGSLKTVPFDLLQRRISTYTADPETSRSNLSSNSVYSLMKEILLSWIQNNDRLPPIIRKTNIQFIKNQRDVDNLKKFFSCFDVYSIQKLYEELPDYINSSVHFDYITNIDYQIATLDFYIHHKKLNKLIKQFVNIYKAIMDTYPSCSYQIGSFPYQYKFGREGNGDAPLNDAFQEKRNKIDELSIKLYKNLKKILDIVRMEDQFIEVDIDALGEQAWNSYYKNMLETKKEIESYQQTDSEE